MTRGQASATARLLAAGLVLGGLTATFPAPASAASVATTVTQSAVIYLSDEAHEVGNTDVVTFAAGGGAATVYPSVVTVSHLARIVDVDVRIDDFTHANPDDVQLVLAQQGGPQVTLMANAGGSTDVGTGPGGGIPLTFDDEASEELPNESVIAGGNYRPRVYGTVSQLPPPAPPVAGNFALSAFDGLPASATWQLFAFDDDGSAATGSFGQPSIIIRYETEPYPSQLNVSGVGTVQDLDVSLHGFTSSYPDDIELLLVGPTGDQVTLMSDAGGFADPDHVELTFDDEAAVEVPDDSPDDDHPLPSGTYRPTDVDEVGLPDTYPLPAPAPAGATSLAVFDGTNPNGSWQLFAYDETAGDVTTVAGWSLDIEWDDSGSPTGSVSIAGGAASVSSTVVNLDLSASDPALGSGVTQMRFSNDATTFSAYQPFAPTASWSLTPGDGVKTVYAQFRDRAGNQSAVVSDTIELHTPVPTVPAAPPPADTTSPSAKKVKPARDAKGVNPEAKVKVVATEALAPASVTRKTVVLKRNGVKVRATVTYKPKGHAMVLVPKQPMKPGKYKVKVTTAVTDVAGNRFDGSPQAGAQPLRWTFRV